MRLQPGQLLPGHLTAAAAPGPPSTPPGPLRGAAKAGSLHRFPSGFTLLKRAIIYSFFICSPGDVTNAWSLCMLLLDDYFSSRKVYRVIFTFIILMWMIRIKLKMYIRSLIYMEHLEI